MKMYVAYEDWADDEVNNSVTIGVFSTKEGAVLGCQLHHNNLWPALERIQADKWLWNTHNSQEAGSYDLPDSNKTEHCYWILSYQVNQVRLDVNTVIWV